MFSQFGATADSISKASTMVFRIGTDAHLYDDPDDANIASLLDSKFDPEKCEALKRLLALIAQGFDVSNFFPQVVKNVASQSLEVKKLVYLYLLHYAEKRPNEALLSINCFQKDLGDPNPLVRARALRTMAGIRLHVIAPLVLVAVNKCARDPSVYVRKCAANALPKLHDLRLEEHTEEIEQMVEILLNDNSPGVIGAAASAFSSVCPNNLSLIAKNYKRLCETLPDIEEWGQIILIGILLRFVIAKHGLVKESIMLSDNHESSDEKDDYKFANIVSRSYLEGADKYLSRLTSTDEEINKLNDLNFVSVKSNDDVKLLLECTSPLLWSHNSGVVLAASGVHWIMSSKENLKKIVKPLLFLLRSSKASKYVVLCNIQVFAKAMPCLFDQHFEDFYVNSSDSYQIKTLKLDILSSIATQSSISSIFQEFQDYVRDPDRRFAADTVGAIGLCAQKLPSIANSCLQGLLSLTSPEILSSNEEAIVTIQAINSIKAIIKQDPKSNEKIIAHLIRSLDSIHVPIARALVIWMISEYNNIGNIIPKMLNTVLEYLAFCFTSESLETKLQILNACVKVLLRAQGDEFLKYKKIAKYVLELAKCDMNYDIRDRARVLQKLVESNENNDMSDIIAEHILFGLNKKTKLETLTHRIYLPGSLSQLVLHAAPGYEPLPEPGSLVYDEKSFKSKHDHVNVNESDSYEEDEESTSSYTLSETEEDDSDSGPLIHLSDLGNNQTHTNVNVSDVNEFGELMSKMTLESWLNDTPPLNKDENSLVMKKSFARISIGDISNEIKPKLHTLLDPSNGNGLSVNYIFSSEVSNISSLLVCVELTFTNNSSELMSNIVLINEETNTRQDSSDQETTSSEEVPTLVPMEEITSLEPGGTRKSVVQVWFHHHLLPVKLVLLCNGKKYPVKLRPDIGYFMKPLKMDVKKFSHIETQLPGMFECMRRCTFTDHIEEVMKSNGEDNFLLICKSLAVKMMSNVNVYLVSVDMPVDASLEDATGLRLRFSGEILSNGFPCLITVGIEGRCSEPLNASVKLNCEETVFRLNLLNRVVHLLGESAASS